MFTFAGFEDYQLSEWGSEGLVKRCVKVVNSVTASLKSAGSIAAVALAVVSAPSMALESSAIGSAHTEISPHAAESMRVVDHVNRMSKAIQDQISNLDNVHVEDIDVETLSLAEQVIAMMNVGGGGPTEGWASRVAIGKAQHG